ncbi:MAG: 4Fe-4S binding protein [Desulfovermiculus sp.]|nr:4Fe-4S binding protein [Desulfovermiculus sp.]
MMKQTGVPNTEDIQGILPSPERLAKGPVAIIECFENIPCNPCYTACKFEAIQEFADINDRPNIDFEACNGCGLCVSACPGLAIFVVDQTYSETEAVVQIPYELLPLPEKGQEVIALDRSGREVAKARVVKVRKTKNLTAVVSLAVPKEHSLQVRFFRTERTHER